MPLLIDALQAEISQKVVAPEKGEFDPHQISQDLLNRRNNGQTEPLKEVFTRRNPPRPGIHRIK